MEKKTLEPLKQIMKTERHALENKNESLEGELTKAEAIKIKMENAMGNKAQEYVCANMAAELVETISENQVVRFNETIKEIAFEKNTEFIDILKSKGTLGVFV